MVVGGVNNRGYLDDVELASLDLVSSGPVPDCLSNLSSLPIQIAEGAGAIDYSGNFFLEKKGICFVFCDILFHRRWDWHPRDALYLRWF